MTRAEVELISFSISIDGQYAVNMKIYKDGTTCRYGTGGLPQLGIGGMSTFDNSAFFDSLISKVPDDVLQNPVYYEENTPNGYKENVIAFFGASTNGETGEYANWTKATGFRLKLDRHTTFRHPVMLFLDQLIMGAIELTNEWYFDIVVKARFDALSSGLPQKTTITPPKTEKDICKDFDLYINQMLTNARQWKLADFNNNKTYFKSGRPHQMLMEESNQSFRIDFIEYNPPGESPAKKGWWKLWNYINDVT